MRFRQVCLSCHIPDVQLVTGFTKAVSSSPQLVQPLRGAVEGQLYNMPTAAAVVGALSVSS